MLGCIIHQGIPHLANNGPWWVFPVMDPLPARLFDPRQLSGKSVHPKLKLFARSVLAVKYHRHAFLSAISLTRAILKSRETPLLFPPIIHLFLICVGRV